MLELADKIKAGLTVVAANAQLKAELAGLKARVEALIEVIERCVEKLKLYRAASEGKYEGGMEYTALIKLSEDALARLLAWRSKE